MTRHARALWHRITVNEDGSPLFGVPWLGPVAVAAVLVWDVWCCLG